MFRGCFKRSDSIHEYDAVGMTTTEVSEISPVFLCLQHPYSDASNTDYTNTNTNTADNTKPPSSSSCSSYCSQCSSPLASTEANEELILSQLTNEKRLYVAGMMTNSEASFPMRRSHHLRHHHCCCSSKHLGVAKPVMNGTEDNTRSLSLQCNKRQWFERDNLARSPVGSNVEYYDSDVSAGAAVCLSLTHNGSIKSSAVPLTRSNNETPLKMNPNNSSSKAPNSSRYISC